MVGVSFQTVFAGRGQHVEAFSCYFNSTWQLPHTLSLGWADRFLWVQAQSPGTHLPLLFHKTDSQRGGCFPILGETVPSIKWWYMRSFNYSCFGSPPMKNLPWKTLQRNVALENTNLICRYNMYEFWVGEEGLGKWKGCFCSLYLAWCMNVEEGLISDTEGLLGFVNLSTLHLFHPGRNYLLFYA